MRKIINDSINESLPNITKEYKEKIWEDMPEVFDMVYKKEDI